MLVFIAPVKIRVRVTGFRIRVQEYTVLGLDPFRIDNDGVVRHLRESVGDFARSIRVPPFKHKARLMCQRRIRLIVLICFRNCCIIGDIIACMELIIRVGSQNIRVVVTADIDTVHIMDRVLQAVVVVVQLSIMTTDAILLRRTV